jgi:hypothetical protein
MSAKLFFIYIYHIEIMKRGDLQSEGYQNLLCLQREGLSSFLGLFKEKM